MAGADTALITGFPAFLTRRLVRRLLEGDLETRVYLLVAGAERAAADTFVDELERALPGARQRVRLLEGEVSSMDLGLTGIEYQELVAELTAIWHLAALEDVGARREQAELVNVEGTRNVIEVGRECRKLRRLVHFSTAQVSGARTGVVLEEELDVGQRFRNVFDETRCRAEKLVQRSSDELPVTILRPGTVVGDSRSGEIDRFDGPYYLVLVMLASPVNVPLPLPGASAAPLHLVPIDFVVEASYRLGHDERAVGKTFHLTDPAPFSARGVYELVARTAERKLPRGSFPSGLARALLRTPGLGDLARAPLSFLNSFDHMVFYNCRQTLALLEATTVRCPPFDRYVEPLVRYVRATHTARHEAEDEMVDPFE